MFIQLNEATNHTVHVSNHGARSTFIALSEALKGGFIMTYIYICNIMCSRCIIQFCDNYYSSIFHSDNLEVIDNSNGTHLLRRVFLPYEELFAIEMNNTIDVSLVRDLHIIMYYI